MNDLNLYLQVKSMKSTDNIDLWISQKYRINIQ